jgi:hypothetical protein
MSGTEQLSARRMILSIVVGSIFVLWVIYMGCDVFIFMGSKTVYSAHFDQGRFDAIAAGDNIADVIADLGNPPKERESDDQKRYWFSQPDAAGSGS